MGYTKFVGRVGGLALGLGVGSALAALPWVASADITDQLTPDMGLASDITSLLPAADAGSMPDFAISFDGMSLLHQGTTATATTDPGSFGLAIAYGDGATASNLPVNGGPDSMFNTAIAVGADSNALSTGGNFGTAIANGADSTAYSNGIGNFVSATGYESNASAALGDYNGVFVNGTNSSGSVLGLFGGGDNNLVSVIGANNDANTSGVNDLLSIVGNSTGDGDSQATTDGMNNIAAIFGDNGFAQAAGGDNNIAAIFGDGGFAQATLGDGNIAGIFGDGSSSEALGTNNLALAFGDLLQAVAQGDGTTFIAPPSFMPDMADLFGAPAADASWLTDFLDGSWLTSLF